MTDPRPAASAVQFPNTHWTALLPLQDGGDTHARDAALREVCEAYWFPIYAFARKRGLSVHDAEDAVQNFFCEIGDAGFFKKADQEKGKLRTFILTAFTRMLVDQYEQAQTKKRGGRLQHFSLDMAEAEGWLHHEAASEHIDPTLSFERHWALTILRTAIANLRAEAKDTPKAAERFEILSRFLNLDSDTDYTPAHAAEELGMSVESVHRAISRLRQHFRLAVRDLVASTLHDPSEAAVTEEMIQLQKALRVS